MLISLTKIFFSYLKEERFSLTVASSKNCINGEGMPHTSVIEVEVVDWMESTSRNNDLKLKVMISLQAEWRLKPTPEETKIKSFKNSYHKQIECVDKHSMMVRIVSTKCWRQYLNISESRCFSSLKFSLTKFLVSWSFLERAF